jgi:hypothetical protein
LKMFDSRLALGVSPHGLPSREFDSQGSTSLLLRSCLTAVFLGAPQHLDSPYGLPSVVSRAGSLLPGSQALPSGRGRDGVPSGINGSRTEELVFSS